MQGNQAQNNAMFYYSVIMLKRLLQMNLLTKEEYEKIVNISAEHYACEG